jgi:glycosyltransferase involved in cell wall biosynthesis
VNDPAVSVIIATRDAVDVLPRCLSSIARQRGCSVEVLVADGGSTDGTIDVLHRADATVTWWDSRRDDGVYDAWNRALPRARGRWICFLGADDELAAVDVLARLTEVADAVNARRRVRVCYAANELVDVHGRAVRRLGGQDWRRARRRFRRRMVLAHPGMLQHRSLFEDHGSFDPCFRISGDYDLLLRELAHGEAQHVRDLVVARVGADGISRSTRTARRSMQEARLARRRNGLPAHALLEASIRMRHWASVLVRRFHSRPKPPEARHGTA